MENKLGGLKLVSIDLFRTLVDLDQTPKIIWETFLKDRYPPDVAQRYWNRTAEILDRIWDDAGTNAEHFISVKAVLEGTCRQLFEEIGSDLNLESAVIHLMQKHRIHRLFDDTRPFLEAAGRAFPLCLSTDCDLEMLEGVHQLYPFQHIFDSESLKAYKLNPAFFRHVIHQCQLKPHEILHIGDSKSDILSPAQLGLRTCWLNRGHQPWTHSIKPDFEVHSLLKSLISSAFATNNLSSTVIASSPDTPSNLSPVGLPSLQTQNL